MTFATSRLIDPMDFINRRIAAHMERKAVKALFRVGDAKLEPELVNSHYKQMVYGALSSWYFARAATFATNYEDVFRLLTDSEILSSEMYRLASWYVDIETSRNVADARRLAELKKIHRMLYNTMTSCREALEKAGFRD